MKETDKVNGKKFLLNFNSILGQLNLKQNYFRDSLSNVIFK